MTEKILRSTKDRNKDLKLNSRNKYDYDFMYNFIF